MTEEVKGFWENLTTTTKSVVAIVGAVTALMTGWYAHSQTSVDQDYGAYTKYITSLEIRLDKIETELANLRLSNAELSTENLMLKNTITLLSSSNDDLPFPKWVKNSNFVMLKANKLYEKVFLEPQGLSLINYIGKTDYEVYPKHLADEYRENDLEVFNTGEVYTGVEDVVAFGKHEKWFIIKYRWKASNGITLGVAGIALPEDIIKFIKSSHKL